MVYVQSNNRKGHGYQSNTVHHYRNKITLNVMHWLQQFKVERRSKYSDLWVYYCNYMTFLKISFHYVGGAKRNDYLALMKAVLAKKLVHVPVSLLSGKNMSCCNIYCKSSKKNSNILLLELLILISIKKKLAAEV